MTFEISIHGGSVIDMFVFIDESGSDNRDALLYKYMYGYSLRGQSAKP